MKNLVIASIVTSLMLSCRQREESVVTPPFAKYPVELSYTGTPAIGNFNNVNAVLTSNKMLTELNPNIGEFFADSVTMHLADGAELSGPRDSVVLAISQFIQTLSSWKIDFIAAIPVNNENKNHEWVFAWTHETQTFKDGKVVSQYLYEDYRIVNGKIREIYQYTRKSGLKEN